MGTIKDRADEVFRDFQTSGVPGSGANEPNKADIRSLMSAVDVAVYAAQAGLATVADTAARDTFYSEPENQEKLVYVNNNNGASDDPANGVYEYVDGAARIATGFYQGVASVVQPLVDRVEAAAATVTDVRLTSREQLDGTQLYHEGAANGATLAAHVISIPAASSGAASYQSAYQAPPPDVAASLAGATIRMTGVWAVSDGFLAAKPPISNYLGRVMRAGVSTKINDTMATLISDTEEGGYLTRIVEFTLGEDDTAWGPGYQIATTVVANADHSFGIVSATWEVVAPAGSAETGASRTLAVRIIDGFDSLRFGAGNVRDQGTPLVQANGGSQPLSGSDGWGLLLPAAQTCANALVGINYPIDGAALAGAILSLKAVYYAPGGSSRAKTWDFKATTAGGDVGRTEINPTTTIDGDYIIRTWDYAVAADDTVLRAWVQLSGATAATDEELTLIGFYPARKTSATPYLTATEENVEALKASLLASVAAGSAEDFPTNFVTVKPSGGDYTHPKLALDAITDASAAKRYAILIYPGTYSGYVEWYTKDYVDLIGIGRREDIVISGSQANDAPDADIIANSLCRMTTTTRFINLTMEITNGRYCIHLETNGAAKNTVQQIINCSVIHHGNDDHVSSTPEDPWGAWASQRAVGSGTSGGQHIVVRGSYFRGHVGTFTIHGPNNMQYYEEPWIAIFEGNTFDNDEPTQPDIHLRDISVGAGDYVMLTGNTIARLQYGATSEWDGFTVDPDANRAQLRIFGHGNTPMQFKNIIPAGEGGEDYVPEFTGLGGEVTVVTAFTA